MRNQLFILASRFLLVVGFQSDQSIKQSAIDNTSFMSLWNTYSHCQNTTDFEQLKHDAVALSSAASRSLPEDAFVLPLPGKLEKLVATPATRLAVDVKAMAAACSIRAGQLALDAGHLDLAKNLFKTVLAELETRFVQISRRAP